MLSATLRQIAHVRATTPATYWFLWWGMLVNRAGSFVVPFLALYLTSARGLSVSAAGAIVSMFGLGQVGASILGGIAADRIGRRFTMLVGLFGGAAATLTLAFCTELWQLTALVFAVGFVGELYRPAVAATIADVVAPEHRGSAFAFLYWAVNLGFAAASLLGGVLARVDFFLLFALDAATIAACGLVVFARVPETKPNVASVPRAHIAAAGGAPRGPLSDPPFLLLILVTFGFAIIPLQSLVVLTVHMKAQGFSSAVYGAVMACNGVLIVLLQPVLTQASLRRDPVRVLAVAVLIGGAGMALHGVAATVVMHLTAVVVWTIGEILEVPTRSAMSAAMSPVAARGRYQGAIVLVWGAGNFVAQRLGSWVWQQQPAALWLGCLGLGAALAGVTWLAGPLWRRRMERGRKEEEILVGAGAYKES